MRNYGRAQVLHNRRPPLIIASNRPWHFDTPEPATAHMFTMRPRSYDLRQVSQLICEPRTISQLSTAVVVCLKHRTQTTVIISLTRVVGSAIRYRLSGTHPSPADRQCGAPLPRRTSGNIPPPVLSTQQRMNQVVVRATSRTRDV